MSQSNELYCFRCNMTVPCAVTREVYWVYWVCKCCGSVVDQEYQDRRDDVERKE